MRVFKAAVLVRIVCFRETIFDLARKSQPRGTRGKVPQLTLNREQVRSDSHAKFKVSVDQKNFPMCGLLQNCVRKVCSLVNLLLHFNFPEGKESTERSTLSCSVGIGVGVVNGHILMLVRVFLQLA